MQRDSAGVVSEREIKRNYSPFSRQQYSTDIYERWEPNKMILKLMRKIGFVLNMLKQRN